MSGEEAPTQQQEPEQEKQPEEPPPAAAAAAAAAPAAAPAAAAAAAAAPQEPADSKPAAEEKRLSFRALVLTGHGGYDKVKLQVKTQAEPQLKAGEVLVRVKACGLNFAELLGRQGLYELLPAPPVVMGMEGSGVIEAVGEDVKDRKVSKRPCWVRTHTHPHTHSTPPCAWTMSSHVLRISTLSSWVHWLVCALETCILVVLLPGQDMLVNHSIVAEKSRESIIFC